MQMSKSREPWPRLPLPAARGAMTASDVLAADAGGARDQAIHDWTVSVWSSFKDSRPAIVEMLARHRLA
jgi:hypothetical protein